MNLVDQKSNVSDNKMNKIMIGIGIAIFILILISIVLYVIIGQMKNDQFKFTVDGKLVTAPNGLFVFEGNDIYVSISDISNIVGYKFYNGGYKQYSEDTSNCYVECDNEICTFENLSDKIYKTPKGKVDYQLLNIDNPVKMIGEKLYISSSGLRNAFNVEFNYDSTQNQVTIYTLPYLTTLYTTGQYIKSGIKNDFNNQKALLYNMLVVQNADNTDLDWNGNQKDPDKLRFGVVKLNGEEIIGEKYTKIEFVENTREFIVTTEEKKVGIITETGVTKVTPQFDALKQIDKDLNLYLATNGTKKGIIDRYGKTLLYIEFDEIGIDTSKFETSNIKNPYILYNNAIPVKQNGKWGLYDIRGENILSLQFDGIGCVSNDQNLNSTVIIPDVEGIVFSKNYEIEDTSSQGYYNQKKYKILTLYGIVNSKGHVDVIAGLENVYFIINNGREEYYMESYDPKDRYNIIDYFNKYIYNQTYQTYSEQETNTTTNTSTNTTTNNITNTVSNTSNENGNNTVTNTNSIVGTNTTI